MVTYRLQDSSLLNQFPSDSFHFLDVKGHIIAWVYSLKLEECYCYFFSYGPIVLDMLQKFLCTCTSTVQTSL